MTQDPDNRTGPAGASRESIAAGVLLLAGLGVVIAGQVEFGRGSATPGAEVMTAGIGVAAAAAWWFRRRSRTDAPSPPDSLARWEWWFLGAVVLAAGILRLTALDRWPPGGFFDEAQNVLVAGDLLKGKLAVYIGDYTQMPALYFYLLAGTVKLLGQSIGTARILSALIGTATIPVFYLLARRLFPGAPAVAATVLLAGSRWHLNFSRIGFTGILCPLVEILSILALTRSFERGRRRDWVLFGATVAVGLQSYYAFNLFPAVLAVSFALLAAKPAADGGRRGFAPIARGLGWAVLTAAILLAPLTVYALENPEEFFRRTGTVAIWNPAHHLQLREALWTNLRAHLLMFNFRGDANPRHNLTGMPLLTSVEGVLLAFGLGCALGRGNRWPQALPLAWIAVMMLPGILTIEAPQAYRTIGAIPAVFLLIAQALRAIGWSAGSAGSRAPSSLLGLSFVALAVTVAATNVGTYFSLQVRDRGAWDAFEAEYGEVATIITSEAHGFRVWVDPIYFDYPDVHVRLGDDVRYAPFLLSDHLPFPRVPGPGAPPGDLYVLDSYQRDLVPLFRRAFPQAQPRQHIDPFGREGLVSISVPWPAGGPRPDPALAGFGLLAAFYDNLTWSGPPTRTRQDPAVLFHFHSDKDGLPGPFTADWAARLRIEHEGAYAFHLLSSDPASVVVDGAVVVAQDRTDDMEVRLGSVRLEPGGHVIVVRYLRDGFTSALRLWWQPPGAPRPGIVPLDNLTPLPQEEYLRLKGGLPVPGHRHDR